MTRKSMWWIVNRNNKARGVMTAITNRSEFSCKTHRKPVFYHVWSGYGLWDVVGRIA